MSPDNWWEGGSQDRTDETLENYSEEVREYLEREGIKGFLLGNPTICGYTLMEVCILDPQAEVFQNVLLFATHMTKLGDKDLVIKPLEKEEYHYNYDTFTGEYALEFETEGVDNTIKHLAGKFDAKAQITEMREINCRT